MPARPIRFFLGSDIVSVADVPPTESALEWLRTRAGRCGTKEGCAEGDCGACTVVVGSLEPGDTLSLQSVNACLLPVPALDGKALFTVEDLATGDTLHPVQAAMVRCHGSQCGFCTPGFVMSLWALYEAGGGRDCSEAQVRANLTGNLCRCTGYRPIIAAGLAMSRPPRVALDRAPVIAALKRLRDDGDLAYSADGAHWYAPTTLASLLRLRAERPDATLVAGNTDVGLWINKALRALPEQILVTRVPELQAIVREADALVIGAAVDLERAFAALAGPWPEIAQTQERFASLPIRHAGTLGGNVANGSPIGDSMPMLIALGASVRLQSQRGSREIPLEALYVAYQRQSRAPDEVIVSLRVPARPAGLRFRCYKVSRRHDSDISAVFAAFAIVLDDVGLVTEVRCAFGGMAGVPARAPQAEAALRGRPWDAAAVDAAMAALDRDFTPLDDHRARAVYRRQVARNLLRRFWLETRAVDPLPADAVQVFALPTLAARAPAGRDGVSR